MTTKVSKLSEGLKVRAHVIGLNKFQHTLIEHNRLIFKGGGILEITDGVEIFLQSGPCTKEVTNWLHRGQLLVEILVKKKTRTACPFQICKMTTVKG